MRPGESCNGSCHNHGYTIMGTVFPSGHIANDCKGVASAAATVVITDCNGGSLASFPTNSAGNFMGSASLPSTWCAEVQANGLTRKMAQPPSAYGSSNLGSCNSCHTAAGANGAPGRITVPAP